MRIVVKQQNLLFAAENPEDRAECNVDGKIYRDGEYFSVASDPDLNCVCQPGYEGGEVYFFRIWH